jgi:lipid A 3-O-deacylase
MKSHLALAVWIVSFAAQAQVATPPPGATASHWTLYEENDTKLISRVDLHDRHYTQGLKFQFFFPEGEMTRLARAATSLLPSRYGTCGAEPKDLRCSSGFTIGQNIYTPQDISKSELQTDERPYAAWLYAGLTMELRSPTIIHEMEIDVGTMGPAALGKKIQTKWHDLINVAYPKGWKNQIRNEPGLLLQYSQLRRHQQKGAPGGWSADFIGRYGVVASNVFTYASAEPVLRAGYNISNDFAATIPEVMPGPGAPPTPTIEPVSDFEFYFFAGGEGRALLLSEVLEGNCCTSQPSHGVRHQGFVLARELGFAGRYKAMRITWRQIHRTREFEGQKQPDVYGAVAVTWDRRF